MDERIEDALKRYGDGFKKITSGSGEKLSQIGMEFYARIIMPMIDLSDGGAARGRLRGIMHQYRIFLPETLVRDKSLLGGEGSFTEEAFRKGFAEGLRLPKSRWRAELNLIMSRINHQRLSQRLKNKNLLEKALQTIFGKTLGR